MPKQEFPLQRLQDYLPEGAFEPVYAYLQHYKVHLTITRKRQSILGDYRHAHNGQAHRVSVNGNLNKFSFLITLLHELAHLLTYENYGHRVQSHGREWKQVFGKLLAQFLEHKIFPADIESALMASIQNPAASSCGDEKLLRVLHRYDNKKAGAMLVEQLPAGSIFSITGNRLFVKGEKIRTRYKCKEVATGKWYLFSGLYEVEEATERG